MTANVLPVRLAVKPGMSLQELARRVSAEVREGLRHQRYRYEDIISDLRLVGRQGLYSLVIAAMPFDYDIRLGDCSVRAYTLGGLHFNDLSVSVYDRSSDGRIEIAFDGNPELWSAALNTANAKRFRAALDWIASASPGEPLGRLQILGEAERDRVLREWNATAVEVPQGTLPSLFEAQAAETPDAVAVQDAGSAMTYAQLDAASNRLARLPGECIAALVIMDGYPRPCLCDPGEGRLTPEQPDEEPASAADDDQAIADEVAEVIRTAGLAGEVSEEDVALLERISCNAAAMMSAHAPRRFDGDALLISSTDRPSGAVGSWRPYIS